MFFLEKNIARIFALIKKIRGRASKTPETFDFEDLLKKQKQNAEGINSIHEAISKADKIVIIYSKDLLDELYFQRKILCIIEKKLKDGVKIVILFNEENKANENIRWYLDIKYLLSKDTDRLLCVKIKKECGMEFIDYEIPYQVYLKGIYDYKFSLIRVSFVRNKNWIVEMLKEEGKLEQANKLKEFLELKF